MKDIIAGIFAIVAILAIVILFIGLPMLTLGENLNNALQLIEKGKPY